MSAHARALNPPPNCHRHHRRCRRRRRRRRSPSATPFQFIKIKIHFSAEERYFPFYRPMKHNNADGILVLKKQFLYINILFFWEMKTHGGI
jgi:hypothetical protein